MAKENKIRFTVSEKRGIFIFVSLILIFFAVRFCINRFSSPSTNRNHSDFESQIAAYEEGILRETEKKRQSYFDLSNPNRSFATNKLTPFEFDPNTITSEGLKALGLSEKQANIITNYKAKGGTFRKKEDFKKMYCISDIEYEVLASYIKINQPKKSEQTSYAKNTTHTPKPFFMVNLNNADTLDLKELRGIGSAFSKRIVAYRDRLGGFHNKNQLLEVYGFSEELLCQIENSLIIDKENIRKIDLNTASIDEMKKHPYLDYYQAKAIANYREKVKPFDNIEEVLLTNLIYEETFDKLKPYLAVANDR